jgi:hypothetical protein
MDEQKTQEITEKKRKSKEIDPIVKVALPESISAKVQLTLKELKARKVDCKAEELLADFFEKLNDAYFEAKIEEKTPEDYYLQIASGIPELRAKLIEQAKKALLQQEGERRFDLTPSL